MIVREALHESRIIVGCTRDSQIHVGASAFQLLASGLYDKMVSLAEAKFMASCNAGESWRLLVEQTPIFGIDEYGIPCFIKGGLVQPQPIGEVAAAANGAVQDHLVGEEVLDQSVVLQ